METFLKFTNLSQGRDRILRTTQYACALSVYLLRNKPEKKDLVAKLKSLESNMSTGRKLFRLGNTVNSIEAAQRTMQLSDPVLCLCLTAANVNRALYFICDNALWATNVGLIRKMDRDRWGFYAVRFYLFSVVMNLTRDVYVLLQLMGRSANDKRFREKMDQHLNESCEIAEPVVPQLDAVIYMLLHTVKSHPAVALDTLKNLCDLLIPLDKVGLYQFNPGVVNCCGLISSLIGIVTLVQPTLRIK